MFSQSALSNTGKVKVKLLSCVRLFVTPWTAAHQAPPSHSEGINVLRERMCSEHFLEKAELWFYSPLQSTSSQPEAFT